MTSHLRTVQNKRVVFLALAAALAVTLGCAAPLEAQGGRVAQPAGGQPVLQSDAVLTTPVGGLEKTNATARIVSVTGQSFTRALQVTLRAGSAETNATQLTLPIFTSITKGDALLASFSLRGSSGTGKSPAQAAFLFERAVDPWTKSVFQGAVSRRDPQAWRRVRVAFAAAESYQPGEAMASLRLAFGPQTVEVGGLSVVDYGKTRSVDELRTLAVEENPLGPVSLTVHTKQIRQTLIGLGGNFCQPRYGATQPMDAVGLYNLTHLRVAHARVGIPLDKWTPEKGVYRDDAQAHAAFLLLQDLARRRIPLVASVWEGPAWMLGGRAEQSGRTLDPARYKDCIEALAQFLVVARDRYGVTVDDLSFNEPNYGVNFLFTAAQMAAFIRQAGPRLRALGLKTRFLVGDTTDGASLPDYVRPLLADPGLAPYLGPLAFHCWDVLGASDARYAQIAALGRASHRPVLCTEAGYDAQLWQAPDPWATWENGLRTALAYVKTLRLTGAVVMDYWTYQDNYPIVSSDGMHPYAVFSVLRQMAEALPAGARVVAADSDSDDLSALATVGPRPGCFSLLLVNPLGPGRVTVVGLPPGEAVSLIAGTVAGQDRVVGHARVDRAGRLAVPLPSRALLTVVCERR